MTEIATLYLALQRGVVVADVLFNRGEKRLKGLEPGSPSSLFRSLKEKIRSLLSVGVVRKCVKNMSQIFFAQTYLEFRP